MGAPALLRSCAPALLRSCDYTTWQPSPPCQAARVTFPSGISQSPHAKATASGSLAAVPTAAGMLTSQSSQPSHSLAPAAFTQPGLLPSAAAPQHQPSPAGGGCSSSFVLDKLHGAEQRSKVIILRHRPLCNLLRGEWWTREPPAGNRRKSRVSSHGHPARPTGGEDRGFYRDVPGFKAQGVFREGLAGVLCHRRGDRITIGLQAMARFTPHGGTVAYICMADALN